MAALLRRFAAVTHIHALPLRRSLRLALPQPLRLREGLTEVSSCAPNGYAAARRPRISVASPSWRRNRSGRR
jgi:hypothetical protein